MFPPVRTPSILRSLYPGLLWNMPRSQPKVYLTFDDGPHETITPQVLKILEEHRAVATFFCVGENAERLPQVLEQIRNQGSALGHHTYNHLKGTRTPIERYTENARRAAQLIGGPLFRPPYGRIRRSQIRALKNEYRIVMWSILTNDYLPNLNCDKVLRIMQRHLRPGDIIVLHDSVKSEKNMFFLLPRILEICREKNLETAVLT